MDLCTRIPPPPIPPWLLDETKEFHRLVTNCSSWTKYTESCHVQVPSEYLQTSLDDSETGTGVNQWIAFIITSVLVTCIVICVCLVYFLYTTNRMTVTCLDDCRKRICKSCTSRKKGYIALSVSEITQLAMEGDQCWVITSPSVTIHELVKRRSKTRRKAPSALSLQCHNEFHKSGEIMLLPERLMVDNIQSSPCTVSLSEREYCSSHSLPVGYDCHKLATSIMQQPETVASSVELNEDNYDNPVIHTDQVKAPKINNTLHKHLGYSSYIIITEARKLVQRCKNAGVSLTHRVQLWHRSSDRWLARHPFVKLRESINKISTPRQAQATFMSAEKCKFTCESYPTTSSEI